MPAPIAPERVLPTLNADGTRRRIRPRLYDGPRLRARRRVAWALMGLFAIAPWVEIGHAPLVLLDVARREFTLFGRTFLPTDGVLLMLLLLVILVGVIWVTALVGRAWCGWACPQTVYMEFLFRPLERLFEGRREDQLRLDRQGPNARRVLKNAVFLLVAFALANVFLSYFVGPKTLLAWMARSPLEHWSPFLLVGATTALVFFDFAFFREQMCTVVCPYARIQSVLLDPSSLIVGYDRPRGEPRGKGKPRPGQGDCIDCNACVVACPTGIDIREGLQLECVACAQCADACDGIMHKLDKPAGLIRYGSQKTLEERKPTRVLRPRVLVYSGMFVVLLGALWAAAANRGDAELTVLRGVGAPFQTEGDSVRNQLRIKVRNRTSSEQRYLIALSPSPGLTWIAPENPLVVGPGAQRTTGIFVAAPRAAFKTGSLDVHIQVSDGRRFAESVSYRLLGPIGEAP
jgi:cytochrome c oxidase accessory protein FixG